MTRVCGTTRLIPGAREVDTLPTGSPAGHTAQASDRLSAHQGFDVQPTRLTTDVGELHDRDGALGHQCNGHRVGVDAMARDAAGSVGGAKGS